MFISYLFMKDFCSIKNSKLMIFPQHLKMSLCCLLILIDSDEMSIYFCIVNCFFLSVFCFNFTFQQFDYDMPKCGFLCIFRFLRVTEFLGCVYWYLSWNLGEMMTVVSYSVFPAPLVLLDCSHVYVRPFDLSLGYGACDF